MQLNCKTNDLAIVIKQPYEIIENIVSKIVRVKRSFYNPESNFWLWEIESPFSVLVTNTEKITMFSGKVKKIFKGGRVAVMAIPDHCLKPIKGDATGKDELYNIEKEKENAGA